MKNGRLSEKAAMVSSTSKGIGAGIALAMGREGAAVAVNYISSGAAAKKVVGITGRSSGIEFSAARRDFVKTV